MKKCSLRFQVLAVLCFPAFVVGLLLYSLLVVLWLIPALPVALLSEWTDRKIPDWADKPPNFFEFVDRIKDARAAKEASDGK